MGRTIASITQTWQQEEAALKRFQRALRKEDQLLLDELLVLSRLHLAEASYASNLYPLDMYLIAILLEVYKQLKSLQKESIPEGADPSIKLDSGKEARFLTLLNETLAVLAPEAPPAVELLEEAAEPLTSAAYTEFEEAP
jgi:hypothetical protein